MSFSFSLIRRVRFCGPAMTRSIASSRASSSIILRLLRAVSSAASLSTLARSAPVKPGVRRATLSRSMPGAIGLPRRVHLEDLVPAVEVGGVDRDLPVEAARTQQRRVEDVGTVGRGDEDDPAADVEAVHLDEQLVEGLLALVVTAAHAGAAVAADGVDLVDEDDRRSVLLGLLEQVADAGGTDADEHLDEVGAGDRVERHAGLARDRAGEQRLAGAGRAVEQHALGDLGAHGLELRRLLEELLDLAELLDGLLAAGDVGEGRLRHVLADQLRLGLGELHDPAAAALHLVHQEQEQQDDQDERQERRQDRAEQARLRVLEVVVLRGALGLSLLGHGVELVLVAVDPGRDDLVAVLEGGPDLLVAVDERRSSPRRSRCARPSWRCRSRRSRRWGRGTAARPARRPPQRRSRTRDRGRCASRPCFGAFAPASCPAQRL